MTPAAKIQAAIELVGDIEASLHPAGTAADRIVSRYFRGRRFAGAGDRAAITDLVYLVLRQRGRLFWLLGEAGDGDPLSARDLVLAALVHLQGMAIPEVAGLFSGEGYAASHLDRRERLLFATEAGVSLALGLARPQVRRLQRAIEAAGPGAEDAVRLFLYNMIKRDERPSASRAIGVGRPRTENGGPTE